MQLLYYIDYAHWFVRILSLKSWRARSKLNSYTFAILIQNQDIYLFMVKNQFQHRRYERLLKGWNLSGPFTQAIFVVATDAIFVAAKWHQVSNMLKTPTISRRQIALKIHLVYTCDFEVATLARQSCRVAATKIACVSGPLVVCI